ncbi:MAG: AEC family transporter [Euryarchaeota archaeon]|nr:AEC family transporter [Euryarchaeota archaeon]
MKLTLAALTIVLICAGISFILSSFFNFQKISRGSFIVTSAHANTGFLGYPICFYFFGLPGLAYAVFYDLGMFLSLLTLITFISIYYRNGKTSIFVGLKNYLTFPPLVALLLGSSLYYLDINAPDFIFTTLHYVGLVSLPLVVLSLGLVLELSAIRKSVMPAIAVSVIRLIVSPIIGVVVATMFDIIDLGKNIAIVQAAMPSGLMPLVLAVYYKLDLKLVSAAIFLSTILSFITLPLIFILISK